MTTNDDLTTTILDFVNTQVAKTNEPIEAHTDLLLTGAVDSLGVIRITQFMEDDLAIEVDPLDVTLENFQTVKQMVDFVRRQQAGD